MLSVWIDSRKCLENAEVLACGTPVISTLVGGVPDYVNDESGWLLPAGDTDGYVDLIASPATNRELAWKRRQAARAQAIKFDWRRIAEQMIALYAKSVASQQAQKTDDTIAIGRLG